MPRSAGFAVIVGVMMMSGCGFRDRGLLARFRARAAAHDYVYSDPLPSLPTTYTSGVPIGMPVSMNGSLPCPCVTAPGIPMQLGPEVVPPGGSWPPNYPAPTSPQQSTPATPGTAPPKPAEPSDTNGSQKSPLPTSKPGAL
jgi:hypothetical protein